MVQLFLQTFLISFSGAAAPGPLMTVVMLRGAKQGAVSGPLATLGHGILEVLLVVAVVMGVAGWLHTPAVTAMISLVGGLVLVGLGLLQLRGVVSAQGLGQSPRQNLSQTQSRVHSCAQSHAQSRPQIHARTHAHEQTPALSEIQTRVEAIDQAAAGRVAVEGFLATASNPYWYIWWVTVGAALLARAGEAGRGGVFVFYAGHITADLVWLTLVGWLISRGRDFLRGRGYRYLLGGLALLLVVFGVFFVQSGIRYWLA
ncbi:MAG: LysE family transporter [Bacteroidota bacterium]